MRGFPPSRQAQSFCLGYPAPYWSPPSVVLLGIQAIVAGAPPREAGDGGQIYALASAHVITPRPAFLPELIRNSLVKFRELIHCQFEVRYERFEMGGLS
jgi:hypothetical protein